MIIDRFIKYMETKGLNDNQVTVDCGLAVGLIGKARKGKSDLGRNSVEKILRVYSDINRDWLISGKGEMLKSRAGQTEAAAPDTVTIPQGVWEVIRSQAASLQARDEQMSRLIAQLEAVIARYERLEFSISASRSGPPPPRHIPKGKIPPP